MDIFLIIILKLYFQLKVRKNTHFKLIVLVTYYFHIAMINNITLYEMEKLSFGMRDTLTFLLRCPFPRIKAMTYWIGLSSLPHFHMPHTLG